MLNEIYKLPTLWQKSIYKFFHLKKQTIAQYYKKVCFYEKLVYDSQCNNIGIDKSLFIRDENRIQERIIGLIDITIVPEWKGRGAAFHYWTAMILLD